MNLLICRAIRDRLMLSLVYESIRRTVEPHAYGVNQENHELLRCWEMGDSGRDSGWRLFRVDEMQQLSVVATRFSGPRSGYDRPDKALSRMTYCSL
jgi:predicted DNA-binding transcriptional regulator YafY